MKTITIQVTDDEHKAIKLAATHDGVSIKEYLLRTYNQDTREPISPKGTPKTGLESLARQKITNIKENEDGTLSPIDPTQPSEARWTGPLMRNPKKGKL